MMMGGMEETKTAACHARRCFCFLHIKNHHPTDCANGAIRKKPPIAIGLRQRRDAKNRRRAVASPIIIGLRQRRNAKKTAEERFNMLARGWLAYPVTPITFATTAEERLYMSPLGLQIIYTTALRR